MHPSAKSSSSKHSNLTQLATDIVAYAKKQGASASACDVSEGLGKTISVRQGAVETIEYNRDKGLSVTV